MSELYEYFLNTSTAWRGRVDLGRVVWPPWEIYVLTSLSDSGCPAKPLLGPISLDDLQQADYEVTRREVTNATRLFLHGK